MMSRRNATEWCSIKISMSRASSGRQGRAELSVNPRLGWPRNWREPFVEWRVVKSQAHDREEHHERAAYQCLRHLRSDFVCPFDRNFHDFEARVFDRHDEVHVER